MVSLFAEVCQLLFLGYEECGSHRVDRRLQSAGPSAPGNSEGAGTGGRAGRHQCRAGVPPANDPESFRGSSPPHAKVATFQVRLDWVHTASLDGGVGRGVSGYDGLWCVPANPYANMRGAVRAVRLAREAKR